MNILRAIFGDRRKERTQEPPEGERRSVGPIGRKKAAEDRRESAIDDLCRTVNISGEEFRSMMDQHK